MAIAITDFTAHRGWQHLNGSRDIVFAGTYTGTLPTSVEVQIFEQNGATVKQVWTALTGATISGGNWSGTLNVPAGGMYRFAARTKDGTTIIDTSSTSVNDWGVGDMIVTLGSSGSVLWHTTGGTSPVNAPNVRRYNSSNTWESYNGIGNVYIVANALNAITGYPVWVVNSGLSGTGIGGWSNTSSTEYTAFLADLNAIGGKVAFVCSHVGINDAATTGAVPSKEAHIANYLAVINAVRTSTGQPDLKFFISGANGRSNSNNQQFDWVREAEMSLEAYPNVYFAATTVDLQVSGDGIHLEADGYAISLQRMALSIQDVYGSGTYHRGARVESIQYTASGMVINIAHVGGTDITVNAVHGFTASDTSGALTVVSAVRQSATSIALTFDRAIVGRPVIKYGAGARPFEGGQGVHDNSALGLPLEIETELAAEDLRVTKPVETKSKRVLLNALIAKRHRSAVDANTLLLLPFDGEEGSQTFVDLSQYNATVTPIGGIAISTTSPCVGTGKAVFDGVNDNLQIANTGNRYNFGTDDFCIEMYASFDAPNNDCTLLSGVGAGSIMVAMKGVSFGRRLAIGRNLVAWDAESTDINWTAGQSYALKISRENGVLKIFVEGTQVYSGANTANYIFNSTLAVGVRITSGGALTASPHFGAIDQLRISNIAR